MRVAGLVKMARRGFAALKDESKTKGGLSSPGGKSRAEES